MQNKSLSMKELRRIERDLDVFLDTPLDQKFGQFKVIEQYGVYDKDEKYLGDVWASEIEGGLFTEDKLRKEIKELLK